MSYQDSYTFEQRLAVIKERWARMMDNYFIDLVEIREKSGFYYPENDQYVLYRDQNLFCTTTDDEKKYYEKAFTDLSHSRKVLLYVPGMPRPTPDLDIILKDLFNLEPNYYFTQEDQNVNEHHIPFFGYNRQMLINIVGMEKYVFVLYNRVRMVYPQIFERIIFVDKMDPKPEEIQLIEAMFDAYYKNNVEIEEPILTQTSDEVDYSSDEEVNEMYESSDDDDELIDGEIMKDINYMTNINVTHVKDERFDNIKNVLLSLRQKIWKITPKKFSEINANMNDYIYQAKIKNKAINATQLKFMEITDHLYNYYGVGAKGLSLDLCSLPGGSAHHMLSLGYDHVYSHIYKKQYFNKNLTKTYYDHLDDGLITLINNNNDGDLTNVSHISQCVEWCRERNIAFNFIFADGAFGDGEQGREQENKNIIHGQIALSMSLLNYNGVFVIKVFDLYEEESLSTVMYLSQLFDEVMPYYPQYSGRCSEEKYLICYRYSKHYDEERALNNFQRAYDVMIENSQNLIERYYQYYGLCENESQNGSVSMSSDDEHPVTFADYVHKCFIKRGIEIDIEMMLTLRSACLIKLFCHNNQYYLANRAFSLIAFGDAQFYIICKNLKRLDKTITRILPWCDIKEMDSNMSEVISDSINKVITKESELITAVSGIVKMVKTVNIRQKHGHVESSITQNDFEEYDMCVKSNKKNGINSYLKYSMQGLIFPCGKSSSHLCSISLYSLGKYKIGEMEDENDVFCYCTCGNVYVSKTYKFICEKSLHVMNDIKFKNTGTMPINNKFNKNLGAVPKRATPFTTGSVGGSLSIRMNTGIRKNKNSQHITK